MPSVTLAESAKLSQDQLVVGVIENIITVDKFFDVLPFQEIEGNALKYPRENALGDVEMLAVGGTVTAKAAATFTEVTAGLTTIIGDAEVNGLIQATRSNINDQKAVQVASKAKSAGRQYRDQLINGDGTGANIEGLLSLVVAGQTVDGSSGTGVYNFDKLDALIDKVVDKDGQVDWIMMPRSVLRLHFAILRKAGGSTPADIITLPSGVQVPAYRGTPIFANDWMPVNQGVGTDETTLLAGTFDDGSMTVGIAGLTAPGGNAGIQVEEVGIAEAKDETITRIKWYCGLANFNEKGLAALDQIKPATAISAP